jgi:hypothetical protein
VKKRKRHSESEIIKKLREAEAKLARGAGIQAVLRDRRGERGRLTTGGSVSTRVCRSQEPAGYVNSKRRTPVSRSWSQT